MNKKIMSLIVVGIFLSATFGSVSACTDGCTIVPDDKKEGCNLSNEIEIKNLTKEEIPMEDFEKIIKLAEEKGYEILYDEAKETIFKNGMRIISIPTNDGYATIMKIYYMERERIVSSLPIYVKREKTNMARLIEISFDKEKLVARATAYYFEGQKLNKVTSIVDGEKNTITIDKNGEITTQKFNGVAPTGWQCELLCAVLCASGCIVMCIFFLYAYPICAYLCGWYGCTALCLILCD
jgi:hypothetical protein